MLKVHSKISIKMSISVTAVKWFGRNVEMNMASKRKDKLRVSKKLKAIYQDEKWVKSNGNAKGE
jgi:AAA15 family ATPase/GTPase